MRIKPLKDSKVIRTQQEIINPLNFTIMKTRNLFIVVLALFMSVAVAAQNGMGNKQGKGQGKKSAEERAQKQTEWMKTDLGLTEAQAKQVNEINLKYAEEAEAKRAAHKAEQVKNKEARKAERDAQKAKKEAELKKVLTPEQYTKFEEKRAERMKKHEARMEERKARKAERKAMRNGGNNNAEITE